MSKQHNRTPSKEKEIPKYYYKTGDRIGKWTIKSQCVNKQNKPLSKWYCECECGKISIKEEHTLKLGESFSCNACRPTVVKFKNGEVFGNWTVIEEEKSLYKGYGRYWKCKCKCGDSRIRSGKDWKKIEKRGSKTCRNCYKSMQVRKKRE